VHRLVHSNLPGFIKALDRRANVSYNHQPMASLLDDLSALAARLSPSELPHYGSLVSFVGALVKTLERDGLKVAEELLAVQEPAPGHVAAAATAGDPQAVGRLASLLERAEGTIRRLEDKLTDRDREAGAAGELVPRSAAQADHAGDGEPDADQDDTNEHEDTAAPASSSSPPGSAGAAPAPTEPAGSSTPGAG
jgi:hypothetical protein